MIFAKVELCSKLADSGGAFELPYRPLLVFADLRVCFPLLLALPDLWLINSDFRNLSGRWQSPNVLLVMGCLPSKLLSGRWPSDSTVEGIW